MEAEVDYVPTPELIKCGEYRGDPIMLFGAYRVRLPSGFTLLSPHSGFVGTVSEIPVPLDDPDFRAHLIASAKRAESEATPEADDA